MRTALRTAPAVCLCLTTIAAVAQSSTKLVQCDEACWRNALAEYAKDPDRNRRRFLALGESREGELPPVVLLALADAYLRSGRVRTADRLFREVTAMDPGSPWQSWAELGLAWSAIRSGDSGGARQSLEQVIARTEDGTTLASFMLSMLDAVDGFPRAAVERFTSIRDDEEIPARLRYAATIGVAYALYWAGDDRHARAAFAELTAVDGVLSDDARYAAARVLLRSGDREGAITELRALAGTSASEPRSGVMARRLLDLDPQAILERGFRGYRRSKLRAPEDHVLELVDWDGREFARALLRKLETETAPGDARPPSGPTDQRDISDHATQLEEQGVPPVSLPGRAAVDEDRLSAAGMATAWAAFAAAVAILAVLRRRRRTDSSARP